MMRTETFLGKREMVKPMASRRRSLMARLRTWHPRRLHRILACPVQKRSRNTRSTTFHTADGVKNVSEDEGQVSRMARATGPTLCQSLSSITSSLPTRRSTGARS